MATYPMRVSLLINGPCAECAHGQGDCRDVQVSEIEVGSETGVRVWCLNCGAYFDVCHEGITIDGFLPYREAAA